MTKPAKQKFRKQFSLVPFRNILSRSFEKNRLFIAKFLKQSTNFLMLIVNPVYNFLNLVLTSILRLVSAATMIPVLGPVFGLIGIVLMSISTVINKHASNTAKGITLLVLALATALISTVIAYISVAAVAAPLGLTLAVYMSFLQIGDLIGKATAWSSIKKEIQTKAQVLLAIDNDTCDKLPLTRENYKWAIIYSKMISLEKNISSLAPEEKAHYEAIEKNLQAWVKKFENQQPDEAAKVQFTKALKDNALDNLPLEPAWYQLAKGTLSSLSMKSNNTTDMAERRNYDSQIKQLKKFVTNFDKEKSLEILNYLTVNKPDLDKQRLLKALKNDSYDQLSPNKDIYRWTKVFSKIIQREIALSDGKEHNKTRYENLALKLESIADRFERQAPDLKTEAIDTQSFDLVSLEEQKIACLSSKDEPKTKAAEIFKLDKAIHTITKPLDKTANKLQKAKINLVYSVCDLCLAAAGIALAAMGVAIVIGTAPVSLPAILTATAFVVGCISLVRGSSAIIFDWSAKWSKRKDSENKLQTIEDHITNPDVQPTQGLQKSSDLAMLRVFRTTSSDAPKPKPAKDAAVKVEVEKEALSKETLGIAKGDLVTRVSKKEEKDEESESESIHL